MKSSLNTSPFDVLGSFKNVLAVKYGLAFSGTIYNIQGLKIKLNLDTLIPHRMTL